jgi:hypothetical protein
VTQPVPFRAHGHTYPAARLLAWDTTSAVPRLYRTLLREIVPVRDAGGHRYELRSASEV